VLDEADEMLDMGFREDIESILSETPAERQTIFFSATMPKPILELTKKYQKNPITIKVTPKELTMTTIEQRYLLVKREDKVKVMERLVDFYEPKLCLVFTNTKRMADELVADLQKDGFYADALHGDMRQAQRTQVMNQFRAGVIQLLVATDVAARGLDVEGVEMVINFDVPQDTEYYVHRIGRTGRAGRKGIAYSLVSRREMMMIRDIERFANTTIAKSEIPSLKLIEERKKGRFLTKILTAAAEPEVETYLSWVTELETAGLTPAQAAATLIKMEIHHQLTGMEERDELQQEVIYEKGKKGKESFASSDKHPTAKLKKGHKGTRQEGYKRIFINVGKKSGIRPQDIVGAIAGETGLQGKLIGAIDIYDKFTFVDVPGEVASMVVQKMKKATIKGFKLHVEEADMAK
jgi:ATP-dependent RNA helicase DeaD